MTGLATVGQNLNDTVINVDEHPVLRAALPAPKTPPPPSLPFSTTPTFLRL